MSSPALLRDSSPSLSRERLGLVLGFIGVLIFGGTLPATRIAVAAIDPLAVTALRTAIAGVCSLALLIVLRRRFPPRELWFQLAVTSICVVILFPFLMALAVQTVDASHGGVVMGALPIATAFVAVLITHERPKPLFWIASIAGAALVVAFALRQGGGSLTPGDLLLFAAVAASAIGYAFSGRLTASMPGWEVISWALVIALPVSLPAAVISWPADPSHIALKPWLALLYAALFPQWIGFFAWNAGLAMGGIARVSQIQLLQPFVTFCAGGDLHRRADHAADRAVRRRRRADGCDFYADAARADAAARGLARCAKVMPAAMPTPST
jgi:drug/metabolite transporter (DMT)-like permease